jgi:hypothetical protein
VLRTRILVHENQQRNLGGPRNEPPPKGRHVGWTINVPYCEVPLSVKVLVPALLVAIVRVQTSGTAVATTGA